MLNNLEKAEVTYPTYSTPFENQSVYNMRSCNKPFDNSTTPTIGTYTTSTIPAQSVDLGVGLYNEKVIDFNKKGKPDGYREEPKDKELGNVVQDVQAQPVTIKEPFVETASSTVDQEYTECYKTSASKVLINNLKSHFKKFKKDLSSVSASKISRDISDLESKIKNKKISIMDLKAKCNKIKEEIQEKINRVDSEKFTSSSNKTLQIVTLIVFIIILCLGGWMIFKIFTGSPFEPVRMNLGNFGYNNYDQQPYYNYDQQYQYNNYDPQQQYYPQQYDQGMSVYPEQQYYDGYSGYPQVTAGRCGNTIKKVGCEGDDCIKVMKLSEFMKEMKHDPLKCGSDDDCAKCPECRDKEVEYDSDEDIEEYDDVGTFEEDTKDPLEDDSNFTVDLNNITLNGGSKLDRKIKF